MWQKGLLKHSGKNGLDVLTETKANLSFFLQKIFNPILFKNALIEFFKTSQSKRPSCSLQGT